MGKTVLEIKNLSKRFCQRPELALRYSCADVWRELCGKQPSDNLRNGEFWALQDVSLHIEQGEVLGVVGHNGAGKSTLINLIAGLIRPTRGAIHLSSPRVALMDHSGGLNPVQTGRENIVVQLTLHGCPQARIPHETEEAIAFAEVGEFIDAPVGTYSLGMRLRVAFSIYTRLNPDLFIVDEAISGGDIRFRAKFQSFIKRYLDGGGSMLLCSHEMFIIHLLCKRSIMLEKGRVCSYGPTAEVITFYQKSMEVEQEQDSMLTPEQLASYLTPEQLSRLIANGRRLAGTEIALEKSPEKDSEQSLGQSLEEGPQKSLGESLEDRSAEMKSHDQLTISSISDQVKKESSAPPEKRPDAWPIFADQQRDAVRDLVSRTDETGSYASNITISSDGDVPTMQSFIYRNPESSHILPLAPIEFLIVIWSPQYYERVIWGIEIGKKEFPTLASLSNEVAQHIYTLEPGLNIFKCSIASLPLAPGKYDVRTVVMDRETAAILISKGYDDLPMIMTVEATDDFIWTLVKVRENLVFMNGQFDAIAQGLPVE